MSAKPHVQFKIPHDLHTQIRAYGDRHGLKGDTAVMLHLVTAFFNKPERLPKTPKRKAEWKPLSAHNKARAAVYAAFRYKDTGYHGTRGLTSSEAAYWTDNRDTRITVPQTTNNVAKRIAELHQEGYLEPAGEYRKSMDSGKMLTVWRRTDKPLPEGL